MIDTHAHLYLEQFDEDVDETIRRAKGKGVKQILLPNVDASTSERMMSLARRHPDFLVPMMGVHPCSVNEDFENELKIARAFLEKEAYCAIGEIGIDLYWDKTYYEQQDLVFRKQLDWSLEMNKPVVIHARDSFKEIFSTLKDYQNSGIRGVFHSFTGGKDEVAEIKDLGDFYFGINGIVTFKNSSLKDVLSDIGVEKLLMETDAPYLAPTPNRGKRNESSYLPLIRDVIANALGRDAAEIEELTSKNARNLFKLDDPLSKK